MTETEYLKRLEYRLCREFEGMGGPALRFLWCDGFMPRSTSLTMCCLGSKASSVDRQRKRTRSVDV